MEGKGIFVVKLSEVIYHDPEEDITCVASPPSSYPSAMLDSVDSAWIRTTVS
jgi:hypothetical protein